MIRRGFGQLGRRHISISTKFPRQVGSRLTGQTQTVMPSRRSQTVEVVLAITGYAPNGSTSGTATATVAHRATIAQTGQPATVLSWLRHPTTIARTEAAAGANTRHPGRNAWALCLRSPSVHQERTRAGSAARVRLLLSEFRRIVDLHGIIFRRVDLRASLGICGCRLRSAVLRSGGLLRRARRLRLASVPRRGRSLRAARATVLRGRFHSRPFFRLLTVTISLTRGVRERNATRFRRGGRRVEMNSG